MSNLDIPEYRNSITTALTHPASHLGSLRDVIHMAFSWQDDSGLILHAYLVIGLKCHNLR